MSDDIIQGLGDLKKSLKQFPENVQKNIMRGAIRAAASAISKDAKKNVPKKEGALKKSIGLTQRKNRNKNLVGFAISPRKDLLVKHLSVNGVEKKTFVSKKTGFKYTNYDNYGGYVEFGTSQTAAHPYLRPAYELKGEDAIRTVKEYMAKRILKEIEKARKK